MPSCVMSVLQVVPLTILLGRWSVLQKVKVAQSCPTLCDPMDYPWNFSIQNTEWVAFPFSRGSSQPRDQTQVSRIRGRFFTSWATGKLKKTRVGSLSVLQWVFLTQGSNQGLLHCRQILYQLSYQWCLCTPLINIPQLSRFFWQLQDWVPNSMRKREET